MTLARATVFYCILLCGRRKESAAVRTCYDTAAQAKTDTAVQTKQ